MVLLEPVVAELSKEKDVDFSGDCVALAVAVALLIAVSWSAVSEPPSCEI
jgi:hypothetical protein